MLIVMDMSTGERLEESSGYDDEVLYAGWTPPQPELELGLQSVEPTRRGWRQQEPRDVEAVLRSYYLAQQ